MTEQQRKIVQLYRNAQDREFDVDQAWEIYERGYSLREVGEITGQNYERLRRAFHRRGLPVRSPWCHARRVPNQYLSRIVVGRWISQLGLDEIDEVIEEMCVFLESRMR